MTRSRRDGQDVIIGDCSCCPPCTHVSLSGDEGPVLELGRWPVLWRCDSCGARIEYDTTPLLTEGTHHAQAPAQWQSRTLRLVHHRTQHPHYSMPAP